MIASLLCTVFLTPTPARAAGGYTPIIKYKDEVEVPSTAALTSWFKRENPSVSIDPKDARLSVRGTIDWEGGPYPQKGWRLEVSTIPVSSPRPFYASSADPIPMLDPVMTAPSNLSSRKQAWTLGQEVKTFDIGYNFDASAGLQPSEFVINVQISDNSGILRSSAFKRVKIKRTAFRTVAYGTPAVALPLAVPVPAPPATDPTTPPPTPETPTKPVAPASGYTPVFQQTQSLPFPEQMNGMTVDPSRGVNFNGRYRLAKPLGASDLIYINALVVKQGANVVYQEASPIVWLDMDRKYVYFRTSNINPPLTVGGTYTVNTNFSITSATDPVPSFNATSTIIVK